MDRIARAASVLLTLLALSNQAAAGDASSLADNQVTGRLDYIQRCLDEGQAAANLWWYGWLIGYGGATVAQLSARSTATSEKQKEDMLVGAVTSGLGALGQIIAPMDAGYLPGRLRAMRGDTPEARRAKLALAESFLRRSAARETRGRSWKTHALAGAVNLGAGLVTWQHYNRSASDGLIAFAIGQLVAEVQIFTQPMRAVHDLREYEGRSDFDHPRTSGDNHPTWYVAAAPGRLAVGCRF